LEATQGFQLSNTKPPYLAAHKKPQQEIEIYIDNRESLGDSTQPGFARGLPNYSPKV
jgi:hypothetical protein